MEEEDPGETSEIPQRRGRAGQHPVGLLAGAVPGDGRTPPHLQDRSGIGFPRRDPIGGQTGRLGEKLAAVCAERGGSWAMGVFSAKHYAVATTRPRAMTLVGLCIYRLSRCLSLFPPCISFDRQIDDDGRLKGIGGLLQRHLRRPGWFVAFTLPSGD